MFALSVTAGRQAAEPRGAAETWQLGRSRAVLGSETHPLLRTEEGDVVIGRADLDHDVGGSPAAPGSVEDVLRLSLSRYRVAGPASFAPLVGEFGFVWIRPGSGELLLVRDHFGIAPLFYQERPDGALDITDSPAVLGSETLDREFVAEFISVGGICNERTIFAGAVPVPPGSVLTWRDGRLTTTRYWRPELVRRESRIRFAEAAQIFRDHVRRAVTNRLEPGGRTWAHLSGGLDSSTVVSMAQSLTERGETPHSLGGTATHRDSLGDGDDPRFAASVVRRYAVANESVWNDDHWAWKDDGLPLPRTDQPSRNYPLYARFRALHAAVAQRGGSTLWA